MTPAQIVQDHQNVKTQAIIAELERQRTAALTELAVTRGDLAVLQAQVPALLEKLAELGKQLEALKPAAEKAPAAPEPKLALVPVGEANEIAGNGTAEPVAAPAAG